MGIVPQPVVVSGLFDGNPFNCGLSVGIPSMVGFRPQLIVVSGLSVGIPPPVGFRPQLIAVSGLLVGMPSTVGFRPQLIVVSGLSVGIPSTVRFRLSRSHRLSQSPFTFFPFS
jgi:hypothetical protein